MVLLCSDGLSGKLRNEEIREIVSAAEIWFSLRRWLLKPIIVAVKTTSRLCWRALPVKNCVIRTMIELR
jgi:hypothetical protein